MAKQEKSRNSSNLLGILAGTLIGGLVGAVTMLLLAPQSGKDTRMQIKQKGIELRDETTEMVDKAVAQMQTNTTKIVTGGREKINEIKEQSRSFATEQLDRVSEAVHAGKKAIENA
ncbi:MAG: YtxH domain-containing protein [Anaerolineales bacterium]